MERLIGLWRSVLITKGNQKALGDPFRLHSLSISSAVCSTGRWAGVQPIYTLAVFGVSTHLHPRHKSLQKGKVTSSPLAVFIIYLWLPDLLWMSKDIFHSESNLAGSTPVFIWAGLCFLAVEKGIFRLESSLGWAPHSKPHCSDDAFLKSVPLSQQTLWKSVGINDLETQRTPPHPLPSP